MRYPNSDDVMSSAFPQRNRASGRVVLAYDAGRVSVKESTNTSEMFSQCLESSLATKVIGGNGCSYLIDLILSTRK